MKTPELKSILLRFDEKELKALQKYLSAFNGAFGEEHQTKLSRLLSLLIEEDKNEEEIIDSLALNQKAFEKLKYRLRDKAFDSLTLEVNTNRSGHLPESIKSFIDAKQDYIKARLALRKGLEKEAWQFINKGIRKAKKQEIYADLLELLYLKQRYVNLRMGKAAFDKTEKEITFYEGCREAYNRAARYAELLHQKVGFNNNKEEHKAFLEGCIKEMKRDLKKTSSVFVHQKLLLFQMQYYEEQKDFKNCLKTALKNVALLSDKKLGINPQQLGVAYINSIRYQLILQQYKAAAISVQHGEGLLKSGTYAHGILQEHAFYMHYYQGQYDKASTIIVELIETASDWPYQKEKWQYLYACMLFQQKEYKAANKLLNLQYPLLEKDKEGWGAYLQLLRIQTQIERQQFDAADRNSKQLLYSLQKRQPKARLKASLSLLQKLQKNGYSFSAIHTEKEYERLASNQGWHRKENLEAEVLRFDEWLSNKKGS
jgi:hypothetical protein